MVIATLNFIKPLDKYETESPYFLNIPDPEDPSQQIIQTNLEYSPHNGIQIEDIRERDVNTFSLEENGFKFSNHRTNFMVNPDGGEVEAYCEEIAGLVSLECNAVHTVCYDYRIRRNDREVINYEKDQDLGRSTTAPPVYPAHIDHTVEGGPKRIQRHLTIDEAEAYLNGKFRARIINVWRPLGHPVEDCPLAICDPRSINSEDLLAADRVTPDFRVQLYYLKYNAAQKWYWLPNQNVDELWFFVNYDSRCQIDGSQWKTCPHAAFMNPEVGEKALARSSIEVRLIVFSSI